MSYDSYNPNPKRRTKYKFFENNNLIIYLVATQEEKNIYLEILKQIKNNDQLGPIEFIAKQVCIHTKVMDIENINDVNTLKYIENRTNNNFTQLKLEPEEEFKALQSWVDGIASMGVDIFFDVDQFEILANEVLYNFLFSHLIHVDSILEHFFKYLDKEEYKSHFAFLTMSIIKLFSIVSRDDEKTLIKIKEYFDYILFNKSYNFDRWFVLGQYMEYFNFDKVFFDNVIKFFKLNQNNIEYFMLNLVKGVRKNSNNIDIITEKINKIKPLIEKFYINSDLILFKLMNTYDFKKKGRHFYSFRKTLKQHEVFTEMMEKLNEIQGTLITKDYAHAYIKGKSIVTCANEHVGARFLLKVDVKSFFESITYDMLVKKLQKFMTEDEAIKISELSTFNRRMRLGLPQSPILSNIVFEEIDLCIKDFIENNNEFKKFNLKYTRYSDDLTFSSKIKDFFEYKDFVKKIEEILNKFDFRLNKKKIRFLTNKYKMTCLSVTLNQGNKSVSKYYRQKIREDIHSLKFIDDGKIYMKTINKIKGQIAFVYSVNKNQAMKLYDYLKKKNFS